MRPVRTVDVGSAAASQSGHPIRYTSNWVFVADVDLGTLGHTWPLLIEEQFYPLRPLALILLVSRLRPGRARVVALAVTLPVPGVRWWGVGRSPLGSHQLALYAHGSAD